MSSDYADNFPPLFYYAHGKEYRNSSLISKQSNRNTKSRPQISLQLEKDQECTNFLKKRKFRIVKKFEYQQLLLKKFKQECSFVIFPQSGGPKLKAKLTKPNVLQGQTKRLDFIKEKLPKQKHDSICQPNHSSLSQIRKNLNRNIN